MQLVSVRQAVDSFLDFARLTVSPSTLSLYKLYLGRFAGRYGAMPLESLTPALVRGWGSSFHQLQAVQRLTSWATNEARLLTVDPLRGLKKIPVGRRLRTVSPVESVRLRRRSSGALRRFIIALGESIARPHELRAVCWADIRTAGLQSFEVEDLTQGRAFFFLDRFKAKNLRRERFAVRVIPISPRLGRLLARLWRQRPQLDARVFENNRRTPWTVNAVRCAFRRLRVRAGIAADRRGENVVAYTLRHSAATAAIVAGVPVAQLAGAMGHADVRMTMRYVHLSPTFLAQVLERVKEAKAALRRKNDAPGLRRTRPDDAQ